MLLAVVGDDNCNCYWEMNCDDNHQWMLSRDLNFVLIVGSEHELVVLIFDVFVEARDPIQVADDVDVFWLVVIFVAYVYLHIYRTEYQLNGKPLMADNTISMAPVRIVMLIQSIVLCNLLHPLHYYRTSMDDLWDLLRNRSYNDKACNERTSYPKLCRFHFLYSPVQKHKILSYSIPPDKILDSICKLNF